jgi:hypothetical protein
MHKRLKWLYIIFLIPPVFLLLVATLFYIPAVQNAAVKVAAGYFSESLGMAVGLEKIRLVFPFRFTAQNVLAVNVAGNDTLLLLDKLTAEVKLRPLFRGNISVKSVTIKNLRVNTSRLFDGLSVRGAIGEAGLETGFIHSGKQMARISKFKLKDADIELFSCDTTVQDTTRTEIDWLIRLGTVDLQNVNFSCIMPCDSVFIEAEIKEACLREGRIDLGKRKYEAQVFTTEITRLSYAADTAEVKLGFDGKSLRLSDLKLSLSAFAYGSVNDFGAVVHEFSAREQSGFYLKNMTGNVVSDSSCISIPSLQVTTGSSDLRLEAFIPQNINDTEASAPLSVTISGNIGKQDLMLLVADTLEDFRRLYPDERLNINAVLSGSVESPVIHDLNINMPSYITANLKGRVNNVLKDSMRTGRLEFGIRVLNPDFLVWAIPPNMRNRFCLSPDMSLSGNVEMDKGFYVADMNFEEQSGGKVRLSGKYGSFDKDYDLSVMIDSLHLVLFMPEDSLMLLVGSLSAAGRGTDIFDKRTRAEIKANITDMYYADSYLTGLSFEATLMENVLKACFASDCPHARGNIVFEGTLEKHDVRGNLTAQVDTLDLKRLNLSDSTLSTSFEMISVLGTDLDRRHSLDVMLDVQHLTIERQHIHPDRMALAFRSEEDTVKVGFVTGDLNLWLTSNTDFQTLAGKFRKLSQEAMVQLKRDSLVDMQALRADFPDMRVHIGSETDNMLYNILREYNIFYETFSIDATISPEAGLDVNGLLLAFVKDTFKIDTVRINIWQDTLGLRYNAGVLKNRFRNQTPFKASVDGYLYRKEADVFVSFTNSRGEKGMDLGINLKKAPEGFDFHLYPQKVVLAFIPFTLNENNFFKFRNIKEMEADIYLRGDNDALFRIHSDTMNEVGSMKEMMVELNRINIEKTMAGFADFRSFKGMLNATLRYVPDEKSYMIIADGYMDSLYYENGRIGEMLLNATYMPVENDRSRIDFHAFHDMNEIAALSLIYSQGGEENRIEGVFNIDRFPLKTVEPFVSGNMLELNGFIYGNFNIGGTDRKPLVSGSLRFDSVSAFAVRASTGLVFENREITMTDNVVDMDKFKIFVRNTPFVIDGNINATNINVPLVNINVSGSNVPLLDAKNAPGRMAYGKLFVNLNTTVTGTLQSLRARGNLNILGKTHMTYVMSEETLETQDGFNNLVRFTYFADTLPARNRRARQLVGRSRGATGMGGNDFFFTLHIDPVVRFGIDMDEEKKNYVEMKGGGDLTFQYTSQGDMLLNGRYSLADGNIRYNIPVIPLTDFIVRNGSYIDWSGDPMNPYLNITAYSRIRSSVKFDGQNRMVDFNSGIRINNYLDKMALEFILEAPNDVNVQNQLASMGAEERSKQAISLLVTGVYLASSGTGTDVFDVNAVLSSFLQREFKNIIGRFLGEAPLSFEVLTYDGLFGLSNRIDYVGRLHTNIISDRFNTTLGLRYTTDDPIHGNRLFLDDISLEYLFDANDSGSVSLFRNKEYKNIFEGEISRTGAGFTIRKKVKSLKDMFFKKSK